MLSSLKDGETSIELELLVRYYRAADKAAELRCPVGETAQPENRIEGFFFLKKKLC